MSLHTGSGLVAASSASTMVDEAVALSNIRMTRSFRPRLAFWSTKLPKRQSSSRVDLARLVRLPRFCWPTHKKARQRRSPGIRVGRPSMQEWRWRLTTASTTRRPCSTQFSIAQSHPDRCSTPKRSDSRGSFPITRSYDGKFWTSSTASEVCSGLHRSTVHHSERQVMGRTSKRLNGHTWVGSSHGLSRPANATSSAPSARPKSHPAASALRRCSPLIRYATAPASEYRFHRSGCGW